MVLSLIFLPVLLSFGCLLIGTKRWNAFWLYVQLCGAAELLMALCLLTLANGQIKIGGALIGLQFEIDGFRKVYALVISGLWFATLLFSKRYFRHRKSLARYFFSQLMTLGATMGVFFSADLYTAFTFFELMSLTSYVWVIHDETPAATGAANTYLAVAVIGGLAALMGILLLQWKLGTTEISALYERAAACSDRGTLYAAGGCVLFGFGAKAGMFPLHIWLPKAHPVAPAPASALLSGILTKTGVWGVLAISCNLFRGDPAWGAVILLLGTVTMLLGALLALFSIDLKRTLACSSMSQIGFILVGVGMTCLLGEENALAARGVVLHMANHSLFKLVLFLCAGTVYMNLHRLDLNEIKGFGRGKPLLMLAFLIGALGIAGVPGWSGYISKTLLHESIVEGKVLYGTVLTVAEWVFLLSGGLTVAYMTKLFVALFLEKHPDKQAEYNKHKHYIGKCGAAVLLAPALLIPAFGLSASLSMDAIAAFGTDFLHAGELEHAVRCFSPENLKGAAISLLIGAGIYAGIVRKLLIKDGKYLDRWPGWLYLETLLYRPLFCAFSAVFGRLLAIFAENRVSEVIADGLMRIGKGIAQACGNNAVTVKLCQAGFRMGTRITEWTEENRVTRALCCACLHTAAKGSKALDQSVDAGFQQLQEGVFREKDVSDGACGSEDASDFDTSKQKEKYVGCTMMCDS